VGYAAGILLVVPLADIAEPKVLVARLILLAAGGLAAGAFAPSIGVLLVASPMIAGSSIVAQILIPLTTTLAYPDYRARIIGALPTGVILGILLSRTISGALGEFTGICRAPYLVQAALGLLLPCIVPGFLTARMPRLGTTSYFAPLRSFSALLRHAPLRLSMLRSFFAFASVSALWSTLAFHLASPAFDWDRRRPGSSACGMRQGHCWHRWRGVSPIDSARPGSTSLARGDRVVLRGGATVGRPVDPGAGHRREPAGLRRAERPGRETEPHLWAATRSVAASTRSTW